MRTVKFKNGEVYKEEGICNKVDEFCDFIEEKSKENNVLSTKISSYDKKYLFEIEYEKQLVKRRVK